MRQEDLVCLAALAADSDPHAWSQRLLADSLVNHQAYVLEQKQGSFLGCTVVGCAVFQLVLDEAELLYIVVNQAHQQQGIGAYFLSELLNKVRSEGIATCLLEVRAGNVSAQALYQKLGFSPTGLRKAYYPGNTQGTREDALLLRCNLTDFLAHQT
jgi:ribosomal-protein-alanine N-acetyltransferase